MSADQSCLMSWLIQNLKSGNETEIVDLIEIKSKFNSKSETVTSAAVGNLIVKLFSNVKIKPGRCKGNWNKVTQRYHGITWENDKSPTGSTQFINIASILPQDFFYYFQCHK